MKKGEKIGEGEGCFRVAAVVPGREPWHGCENNKEGMSGRRTYELSAAIVEQTAAKTQWHPVVDMGVCSRSAVCFC